MIKLTVSRNDNIYECFPDIAMTSDGDLVCVYRECMGHGPFPFSRISVRRSHDGGMNWMEREILTECVPIKEAVDKARPWLSEDDIAGYEQTLSRVEEDWQVGSSINCPRMIPLADGTLFLVADFSWRDEDDVRRWQNKIWRSRDGGLTWEGPQVADIPEGLVPSLTQLKNGQIMLCLATPNIPNEVSFICKSADGGHTWSEPVFLPDEERSKIDEVSFLELDDGTIVGFGRNLIAEREQRASIGLKIISRDGGETWSGPFETWMVGLEGRPKSGLLASGEVCVTYRCGMPNELLGMHLMTQDAAKFEKPGDLIPRQPLPEDIPAQLAEETGEERPWYMTSYYPGRTFILDCDRSVHRDSGYTGWVQLPSGDIYVVDYINDDAPLAQIRGYLVSRSDYILFPEGDLPWLHPSNQPFRKITYGLAREQNEKNRGRK